MLLKLLKEAANILAPAGFDIEIVEKHHNRKVDAPSGTALALADSINESLGNVYEYKFDRSQTREKREKKEIGISAVRGGTIVGDHDVILQGQMKSSLYLTERIREKYLPKGLSRRQNSWQAKRRGFMI